MSASCVEVAGASPGAAMLTRSESERGQRAKAAVSWTVTSALGGASSSAVARPTSTGTTSIETSDTGKTRFRVVLIIL